MGKILDFFDRTSIAKYLLIPFILIGFHFIFNYLYIDIKNNTIREFNNEQLLLANTAAQGISSFLSNYQFDLEFIAKDKAIIEYNDICKKSMKYFYETRSNAINAITRVDASGNILYTYPYNESIIGLNISKQDHVKKILSTQQPVISDVFMSVQGYYAIAIHVPIFNENKFVGSLAILIPIDKLGKLFLDNIGLNKKGHAWLITQNGTEIYCRIKGHKGKSLLETTNFDFHTTELLKKIKKNNTGTGKSIHQDITKQTNKNLENLVVFQRVQLGDTYWVILISFQENEVYKALSKFRLRLLIVLALLLIISLFYVLSFVKVRKILKEEAKRKKAEKLLKKSEEKFRALFISAGDASLVIKEGIVTDCNTKATKLFKGTKEQIVGLKIWEISPQKQPNGQDSKQMASQLINNAMNQQVVQFEWQHKEFNGKLLDTEVTLSTIDKKNKLSFAIIRDVTEKKKVQKAYKESNERFISFMENTPILAYIKDSSLNHIYKNKKLNSMLNLQGADKTSAIAFHDKKIVPMLEAADRQILSGEKINIELIYPAKINGNTTWFKELKFRIFVEDNEYAVGGAVFDITEIKNYEIELEEHKNNLEKTVKKRTEELELANKELKQQKAEVDEAIKELKKTQTHLVQSEKMASLGTLTAGVSHEINNPLNYLSSAYYGFVKYFMKYGSNDEKKTKLLLKSTETAITRISDIVKGLNAFSRDKSEYDEDCEIHTIIENCLNMLYSKLKGKITIKKSFCSQSDKMKGNVGKLHQVFLNILNNSIQSIENNGQITLETLCANKYIRVEIADTGCGICNENLSKITDPFFTTKPPGKGTGLGLSITYSIIEEHKGSLEFESELGKGTKAIINFPLNSE